MTYYLVMCLEDAHNVNVFGKVQELKMSWADGMIGVVAVFDSKEDAEKYSDGAPILPVKLAEEEVDEDM